MANMIIDLYKEDYKDEIWDLEICAHLHISSRSRHISITVGNRKTGRNITLYREDHRKDIWMEMCHELGRPLLAEEITICADDVKVIA